MIRAVKETEQSQYIESTMSAQSYNYESQGLQSYFREIGTTALLTRSEEISLGRRVRNGDTEARERMINANLRLVVKIAKPYAGMAVHLSDLIAEGNIGLMKAVERFDPDAAFRFSTYASWWIKQAVQRALSNQSRTIRIPTHTSQKLGTLRRITSHLASELGRDPSIDELSSVTGLNPSRIEQLNQITTCTQSLDAPLSNDGDALPLVDMLCDERAENPVEELAKKLRHEQLPDLLACLKPIELQVIERRFGLGGKNPMTLDEIGRELELKRERIRQLESISISKMRKTFQRDEKNRQKKCRQPCANSDHYLSLN